MRLFLLLALSLLAGSLAAQTPGPTFTSALDRGNSFYRYVVGTLDLGTTPTQGVTYKAMLVREDGTTLTAERALSFSGREAFVSFDSGAARAAKVNVCLRAGNKAAVVVRDIVMLDVLSYQRAFGELGVEALKHRMTTVQFNTLMQGLSQEMSEIILADLKAAAAREAAAAAQKQGL